MLSFILFFFLSFLIFFLNKISTKNLYFFLLSIFKKEKITKIIFSFIFFPGTLLHELSHYFTALILFLNIKEIKIFPEFKENQIKLGHVLYYKKDFLRAILVGVAPFLGALLFLFFIFYLKLFPTSSFWQNLFFGYLIFAISSTMFSSKEDLVDIIYLFPLFLIIAILFYIFNIKIDFLIQNQKIIQLLVNFLNKINFCLFITIFIHLLVIGLIKLTPLIPPGRWKNGEIK